MSYHRPGSKPQSWGCQQCSLTPIIVNKPQRSSRLGFFSYWRCRVKREFATLPDDFRQVKESIPELSRAVRLRFLLQTFWICYVEGSIEYLGRFLWLESIRYKLAHDTAWGCILFWNESDNHPYRFWYRDCPADLRILLTNIAAMNFKQRVRFLVGIRGLK